ncbi:hypothetical protein QQY79_00710 [Flavobacterium tructae]|uniref:hypothetical protein n=1 Tax=Flavobacterium tructae TaxID=1114873 RepID=UPI002551D0B1|nr:hypothetical protein [Flavobacterium tructae]MDL2141026.1 hypothetical protein [Flavobacterium tructae]
MEIVEKKGKIKIWLNLNFWFGVIGILGFLFSVYIFIYPDKPELKYYTLANTSVLDVKEKINNLTVNYDSINILESNQNISIILLEVKNIGTKNITLNDYDEKSPFGVKIIGGKLLKKPELIASSDNIYLGNIISNFTDNQVRFNYKLIDQDQYFRIKLLILHSKKTRPNINAIGKISGMDKIEVVSNIKLLKDLYTKKTQILIILFTCISIITIVLLCMVYINRQQMSSYLKLLLQQIDEKNSQIKLLEDKKFNIVNDLELQENETNIRPIIPNNVDKLLSFEEARSLKKDDLVFHERFGIGKVVNIEIPKNIRDSKIDINFTNVGLKKLLIRFTVLYKLK